MKVFLVMLLFLLSSTVATSQDQNKIDGFHKSIYNAILDTNKVDAYLELARGYAYSKFNDSLLIYAQKAYYSALIIDYPFGKARSSNLIGLFFTSISKHDSAMFYNTKSFELFEKMNHSKGMGSTKVDIANGYYYQSEYLKAMEIYKEAFKIGENAKDTSMMAMCELNIGNCYFLIGNNDKALEQYIKSLNLKIKIGDKNLSNSYLNIANIYYNMQNTHKASEFYRKALELRIEENDKKGIAACYSNIANVLFDSSKYDEARKFIFDALAIREEIGDKYGVSQNYNQLGQLDAHIGRFKSAKENYNKAIELKLEIDDREGLSLVYFHSAKMLLKDKQIEPSLEFAKKAYYLCNELSNLNTKVGVVELLTNIYESQGKYRLAFEYHKEFKQIFDSLQVDETKGRLDELTFKFELDKKEDQINLLAKDMEIANVAQKNQSLVSYGLAIILSISLALILVLYLSSVREKRSKMILQAQKDEIEKQSEALKALNTIKDRLFSIISHDLRSPLSHLRDYIELVTNNFITHQEAREWLPELSKDLNYTLALTDNLLVWAKSQLESGQATNFSDFPVDVVVHDNIALFSKQATLKGLEIRSNLEADDRIHIKSDKEMLRLILRNLINNAIKFSKDGDKIQVNAFEENNLVRFEVVDTGVGMTNEQIDKIFTTSLESTRGTNNEKGSGLGLKLIIDFIKILGGELEIESEVGKGSKFSFSLPK